MTNRRQFTVTRDNGGSVFRDDELLSEEKYECHGLDTQDIVYFYEQDFYILSNFSSFALDWKGKRLATSEHAYHWEKFPDRPDIQFMIQTAKSAHAAFGLGQDYKCFRRPDWDNVKERIMKSILLEKVNQHEYVKRKLIATGDRKLVENSWRCAEWGWGPNKDGKNLLGKLWMEVRNEILNK